jgi:hypothetical protein
VGGEKRSGHVVHGQRIVRTILAGVSTQSVRYGQERGQDYWNQRNRNHANELTDLNTQGYFHGSSLSWNRIDATIFDPKS